VGDAMSATNSEEPDIVRREDGSLLLDGMLLIDKLKDVLHVPTLPNEGNFETLGGFVMTQIGSVPTAGNHFEIENWRFEVVDMDGHRVDKVLAQQKAPVNPKTLE
jgi:putative hemolysin